MEYAAAAVLANTVYGAATGTPGGLIGQLFGADTPSPGGGSKPTGKALTPEQITSIASGKGTFRGNASDLGVDTDTYNYLAYKAYGSWIPNGDGTYTNSKSGTVSSSPDAGTFRTYSSDEDSAFASALGVKPPKADAPATPAAAPAAAAAVAAAPAASATDILGSAIPVAANSLGADGVQTVSLDKPPVVTAPPAMPTLSTTMRAAKRQSIADMRRRQGRASTILTDTLGGG